VLLAAVEGEHHVLGLRMIADALRAGGHDVVYLGADVPEDSLLTAVDRHAPQAVCLTSTLPAGGRALVATARRLRSRHPGLQVLAGGPGVPVTALQRSGIEVAESPEHALDLIGRAHAAGAGQIRVSRLAAATG
jgi:methanogenic corrinoid protein MtbC1